jgi:antirestriction protein
MKYEIEDGEVKMPISELNRLNKIAENLELRDKEITEREDNKLVCFRSVNHHDWKYSTEWMPINDAMEKMKKEIESKEEYISELEKENDLLNKWKTNIKKWNIKEFKKYKKDEEQK